MKVAVILANGQLSCDVCKAFAENNDEVIQLNHEVLDITDLDQAKTTLEEAKPAIVINTAAMHNVDTREANPARAFDVNGIGARNLVRKN